MLEVMAEVEALVRMDGGYSKRGSKIAKRTNLQQRGKSKKGRKDKMDWKFFMIGVIILPVIMLMYFLVVFLFPQLGLASGIGLFIGALVSLIVAVPIAWFIAKRVK